MGAAMRDSLRHVDEDKDRKWQVYVLWLPCGCLGLEVAEQYL